MREFAVPARSLQAKKFHQSVLALVLVFVKKGKDSSPSARRKLREIVWRMLFAARPRAGATFSTMLSQLKSSIIANEH